MGDVHYLVTDDARLAGQNMKRQIRNVGGRVSSQFGGEEPTLPDCTHNVMALYLRIEFDDSSQGTLFAEGIRDTQ